LREGASGRKRHSVSKGKTEQHWLLRG
jgi:hypothetical protein